MVLGQDKENHVKKDDIRRSRWERAWVARFGSLTMPAHLIPSSFISWWPTSSLFFSKNFQAVLPDLALFGVS
jgi:hypothetical protein